MSWKLNYLRMWKQYYGNEPKIKMVDDLIYNRDPELTEAHLNAYKYGLLLEALGKLKFPN